MSLFSKLRFGKKKSKKNEESKKEISVTQSVVTPNTSTFSLSNDNSSKELWLVRHGERIDETENAKKWHESVSNHRRFDPPLTNNGITQATVRGKALLKELSPQKLFLNSQSQQFNETMINRNPTRIYVSALDRTIATAVHIAVVLQLPITVVPGLAECAAIVHRCGVEYIDNILYLTDTKCPFLSETEIIQKYGKLVDISFDYSVINESFEQCVYRLLNESKTEIILAVTHREGLRDITKRQQNLPPNFRRVPYCGRYKYHWDNQSQKFIYFDGYGT